MQLNTVIFDMDGLLIDSEPLWKEAAQEIFPKYNVHLTKEQYASTTGLRMREFVHWWFAQFGVGVDKIPDAEKEIQDTVLYKVKNKGKIMPGVEYIFNFFFSLKFKIGIASSSSENLIQMVIDMCRLRPYLNAIASAEHLPYGKPHPQVYLNCAEALGSAPTSCICFEDSFNGMIAAKAARMKCVVVPEYREHKLEKWGAADLKLSSLKNFNKLHLELLGQ
jgi:sugar-phosphatase